MTKQRIYLVNGKGETRLIRATTRHQSIMHVAGSTFSSQVASQEDLIQALQKGVEIENYKDHDQGDLPFNEE